MSAADQVFQCTELLEHILSFTSINTLLVLQRVCRRWRDVIRCSTKLQRALYFKPDLTGDVYGLNPLLVQRFTFARTPDERLWISTKGKGYWRNKLLSCKNASWRGMLFTQPPEPFSFVSHRFTDDSLVHCNFEEYTTCGEAYNEGTGQIPSVLPR
ncbi:uncharacterized protein K452DRAFT_303729 [Aplosporella prunicola CBS 121167]|uniref:F-box domain-containing protein n=1 Tax=Aplosporella prunicola CBS 121167 TaxID=1176127 RepID=A0A6A6AT93_9PEZI|nr:uncharacterized protein K452DRAFT_303729 [Aplosporella prunicola CBS 121167]KAF2135189.1 hypothetical protein K452DRAFT_303729 [Aplosporella prunicola CBS 121167]